MNKMLQIFKNELITTITRRSFILTLVLVPLVGALVTLVINRLGSSTGEIVGQVFSGGPETGVHEGYVDQAGVIHGLPEWVPAGRLTAYPDVEAAREALNTGQITAYYIIEPNYLDTGDVLYIRPDFNPMTGSEQSAMMHSVLQYALLDEDPQLQARVQAPLNLQAEVLDETNNRDQGNALTFFLPYAVTMLFYVVILTASGLMLNSVTTEKENRVMEILMSSVTPIQLLTGKLLALAIVGLAQTMVWLGTGFVLLRLNGSALSIPENFQLPTSILVWGAVFFLLGYAVYAALMAGIGALVPNLREASQATTVVIIPLVIPLLLLGAMVNDPNATLPTVVSLFPLTAPVAMMARLAAGTVPFWQPVLAAVLLALTAVLILRSVAAMFRAQTLLSGQSFQVKRFLRALAGKG